MSMLMGNLILADYKNNNSDSTLVAENYGKQTLKGILLSNEKMSCGHIKSPFHTLQRLKDMFCGEDESAGL